MSSKKYKKKRKLKRSVRIMGVLSLLLIVFGVWFQYKEYKAEKNVKETPKTIKKKEKPKEPKEYTAKIVMVGDALIHSGVYIDARETDGSYDFKPIFEYIKPITSKYDLAYYNQETILGGASLGYSSYPMFNSPTEVGDAFLDAGFNMVSLATNHTMDKGERGVLNSVEYWKTKNNVATSGQWSSEEERTASVTKVYEVNNIKYAFISYTIWTNGLETPAGKEYLNNVYSEEKAKKDIESVRDKVDFVIVAMHWGTEYSLRVDVKQEQIANYLSSLGVDLIIGAHPHVVQTMEYINDNKTFVIYSLGNFVSDQDDIEKYTGLMAEVTLKKRVEVDDSVKSSVESPRAQLIYTAIDRSKPRHKFRVVPYPQLTDSQLRNHETYYEKYKKVVSECYPELVWRLSGEE